MRILEIHNYHVIRGGSDVMFDATVSVLKETGHEVFVWSRHNSEIRTFRDRIVAAIDGFHSSRAAEAMRRLIRDVRPDLVHLHNPYPLISPSIIAPCVEAGTPVVMRLADYSLICPTSHYFRSGSICTKCAGGHEYQCVINNCRGSIATSIVYAVRTATARVRRTFLDHVDMFHVSSDFVRQQYVSAGFPSDRIRLVPNVVSVPPVPAVPSNGTFAVYVGRISPEKGVDVLLRAARACGIPLVLIGNWSRMPEAIRSAPSSVSFLGELSPQGTAAVLHRARFSIVPSTCMEPFSLACAEAMAAGVPPIASRIGGLPELVEHEQEGLLFDPGNAEQLSEQMERLWTDPDLANVLGTRARAKASKAYCTAAYLDRLSMVFHAAVQRKN